MRFTNMFFNNNSYQKENKNLDIISLMEKACIYNQSSNGFYNILSVGTILEDRIISVLNKKMKEVGFSKIRTNIFQDIELWEKSQRLTLYGNELFKIKSRNERKYVLSATAEEAFINLYYNFYNNQNKNIGIYQIIIGEKYRKNNCLEIINRKTKEFKICNLNDFINFKLDKKSFF